MKELRETMEQQSKTIKRFNRGESLTPDHLRLLDPGQHGVVTLMHNLRAVRPESSIALCLTLLFSICNEM